MKPTTAFILLTFFVAIGLTSCKNPTKKTTEEALPKTIKTKEVENDTTTSQEERKKEVIKYKTLLRPGEEIPLEKVYIDTVRFIYNEDNFDYWYFQAQKKNDTIAITYDDDETVRKLVKGDRLVIHWELKKLEEAGDPGQYDIKPFLVSYKKLKNRMHKSKTAKVLWRENLYDKKLKTEVNTLVFNNEYLQNVSEQEKAALAYITTFVGNECEWDNGKPNDSRSNLNCQFLSALNLGYQCSETHLGFLRNWFSQDPKTLEKLETCPTIPNTATIQSTLDEVSIETIEDEHLISVQYNYLSINSREGKADEVFKTLTFEYDCETIVLLSEKK